MEIIGFVFGMVGMTFGIFGILAYYKITALEKKIKDSGVLDKKSNPKNEIDC